MRNSEPEAMMFFAVAVASADTMSLNGTKNSPKPPATMEIRNSTPAILAYVFADAARACAIRRSSFAIRSAIMAGSLVVRWKTGTLCESLQRVQCPLRRLSLRIDLQCGPVVLARRILRAPLLGDLPQPVVRPGDGRRVRVDWWRGEELLQRALAPVELLAGDAREPPRLN